MRYMPTFQHCEITKQTQTHVFYVSIAEFLNATVRSPQSHNTSRWDRGIGDGLEWSVPIPSTPKRTQSLFTHLPKSS